MQPLNLSAEQLTNKSSDVGGTSLLCSVRLAAASTALSIHCSLMLTAAWGFGRYPYQWHGYEYANDALGVLRMLEALLVCMLLKTVL